MKVTFILIIVIWKILVVELKYFKEKDGVILLNEETFDKAIAQYSNILVQFTSTWCGKCERIESDYSKAA